MQAPARQRQTGLFRTAGFLVLAAIGMLLLLPLVAIVVSSSTHAMAGKENKSFDPSNLSATQIAALTHLEHVAQPAFLGSWQNMDWPGAVVFNSDHTCVVPFLRNAERWDEAGTGVNITCRLGPITVTTFHCEVRVNDGGTITLTVKDGDSYVLRRL